MFNIIIINKKKKFISLIDDHMLLSEYDSLVFDEKQHEVIIDIRDNILVYKEIKALDYTIFYKIGTLCDLDFVNIGDILFIDGVNFKANDEDSVICDLFNIAKKNDICNSKKQKLSLSFSMINVLVILSLILSIGLNMTMFYMIKLDIKNNSDILFANQLTISNDMRSVYELVHNDISEDIIDDIQKKKQVKKKVITKKISIYDINRIKNNEIYTNYEQMLDTN